MVISIRPCSVLPQKAASWERKVLNPLSQGWPYPEQVLGPDLISRCVLLG